MSDIPERLVVRYLIKKVEAMGGEVRKVAWIGRRGAPDLFVMIPGSTPNFWAEMKAPGKVPEPHQQREIDRMLRLGEIVHVLDTYAAVDAALLPWGSKTR